MKPFIPWIGGKGALIDEILPRFPTDYYRYVEVFGGGASVLFAKTRPNRFEIYNDYQINLVNLFRVVKEKPLSFLLELNLFPINSREDFNHLKNLLSGKSDYFPHLYEELKIGEEVLSPSDYYEIEKLMSTKANQIDVQRAVTFYKLIRLSYASGGKSFGARPITLGNVSSSILNASQRLRRVVIENKDFEDLILQYDREDTFFYCDPPYFETEQHYDAPFSVDDHVRLKTTLDNIKGKFLLSYNDTEYIRDLYKDYYIVSVERINNLKQRYDAGSMYVEILISNYDINIKNDVNRQTSLF